MLSKPATPKQRREIEALKRLPESAIDFSDIPELTDEQIGRFERAEAKTLISVRIDGEVLAWLQAFGAGYSTRINSILRSVMQHQKG